jgi:hypothetical protein
MKEEKESQIMLMFKEKLTHRKYLVHKGSGPVSILMDDLLALFK